MQIELQGTTYPLSNVSDLISSELAKICNFRVGLMWIIDCVNRFATTAAKGENIHLLDPVLSSKFSHWDTMLKREGILLENFSSVSLLSLRNFPKLPPIGELSWAELLPIFPFRWCSGLEWTITIVVFSTFIHQKIISDHIFGIVFFIDIRH